MIYGFVVICLFGSALSHQPPKDSCLNVETMKDFNISKYLGRWYEAVTFYKSADSNLICMMFDHSLGENGTIKIANFRIFELTGELQTTEHVARVPDPSEPAKLIVDFAPAPCNDCYRTNHYWILGTDYDSFAVVYICTNIEWITVEYGFIWTRSKYPSTSVIAKANEVIEKSNITISLFVETDYGQCEIYL